MFASMRAAGGAVFLCAASALSAQAAPAVQTAPAVAAPAIALAPASRLLPAGTQVELTPQAEIASSKVRVGDKFNFTVVNDVVEQGVVAIPRGSIATGVINWKTGKAIGGKSGKFEVTFESLTANGHVVPLMGVHRQEGKGNTVGALFGSMWISGRSAIMQPGQIVKAMVKEATTY